MVTKAQKLADTGNAYLTVRVPLALLAAIEKRAAAEDRTVSWVVRDAIRQVVTLED